MPALRENRGLFTLGGASSPAQKIFVRMLRASINPIMNLESNTKEELC